MTGDNMNEKELHKWENEYINGIDLSNIQFIKLNKTELRDFFRNNYLDKKLFKYVSVRDSYFACPLGLHYLEFNSSDSMLDYSYLLGIVNNNKGTKTIVSDMIYLENYNFFGEKVKPITYISSVEVNSYFRNKGIFKLMSEQAIKYINLKHNIITSPESDMGKTYHTYEIFKNIMVKNGFNKGIWNEYFIEKLGYDFFNYLKDETETEKKEKVLRK